MPLTDHQRGLLVAETESWIGTPYRGWSCVKGSGVDCGQIIYGVYHKLGHLPAIKLPTDYSLQIAAHQASTAYVDLVSHYFAEIKEADVKPADIVIYKLGLAYAHAAIVIKWPEYVLQAVARHGVSGQHGVKNPVWRNHPRRFFTLKDQFCGKGDGK